MKCVITKLETMNKWKGYVLHPLVLREAKVRRKNDQSEYGLNKLRSYIMDIQREFKEFFKSSEVTEESYRDFIRETLHPIEITKYTSVIIDNEHNGLSVDNINIPAGDIPVTVDFDHSKSVGFAKLVKSDNKIIAHMEIDMKLDESMKISFGSEMVENKATKLYGAAIRSVSIVKNNTTQKD